MSKFCSSCGKELSASAQFCPGCGKAYSKEKNIGVWQYIKEYIGQSLAVFKNPKQMIPTVVLGIIWMILALLSSFGINPQPVRILSFITFAQGGMFGGVLGAVGGIIGKIVVVTFLNTAIIPIFQKKRIFVGFGRGIKVFFSSLAIKSFGALSPLLGGIGVSLIFYAFMNITQSMQNSMVGIISFIMLLQSIGRKGGFLWGIAFSIANGISRGRVPSYITINRFISGMTLGFAIGVGLSAINLSWCSWIGLTFLVMAIVFVIVSKSKKEVAAV